MSEIRVNQEVLARAVAGFWVALQEEFARERASDLHDVIEGHGERLEVASLPALPAWQELPEAVREALGRHLSDSVCLSALGYCAPKHDHFVLERIWRWCEAVNLRGRLCAARTSFHRHKIYGRMAAVCMGLALEEGMIVHFGHLVIVLSRYQARGERALSEQDLIKWKHGPDRTAEMRERWRQELAEIRAAIVLAEADRATGHTKERRAV
jgi:hypothetical protein